MKSIKVSHDDFNLLRGYLKDFTGINLGDEKDYLIESRLSELAVKNSCKSLKELHHKTVTEPRSGLRDKIINAMTTNETLWFRDKYPFAVLQKKILPEYVKKEKNKIRIWSMGSSTGQEPYSIAISIHEFCKKEDTLKPEMFDILATDISSSILFQAVNGNYDNFAMKMGMNPQIKAEYFKKSGKLFSIKPDIKKMVTFKQFEDPADFHRTEKFDIIFCRYMTLYFSDENKKRIYSGIAGSLNPEGILFVGDTESIDEFSTEFSPVKYGSANYYRNKH